MVVGFDYPLAGCVKTRGACETSRDTWRFFAADLLPNKRSREIPFQVGYHDAAIQANLSI